jgi:hypothetical protein
MAAKSQAFDYFTRRKATKAQPRHSTQQNFMEVLK